MDPVREAVIRLVRDRRGLEVVEGDECCPGDALAELIELEMSTLPDLPRGPVFAHLGNRIDLLVRFLALIAAGFRPVVLPARVPPAELESLLTTFFAIPYDKRDDGFVGADGRLRTGREPKDAYTIVLPTSGSTGKPRLVAGVGQNITNCIDAIEQSQGLDSLESTAAVLPAHFSYCLVNQVLWSLTRGARLVLTPGIAVPLLTLELLKKEKVQFTCLVAQQLRVLRSLGCTGEDFSLPDIRVVNCAGGPFFFDCWNEARSLFPSARFNNNYGCTEAFPRVSARQVHSGEDSISNVGRPIDGLDVWIQNDGEACPPGTTGRIFCRGKTTGIGLLRPDGSVEPFSVDGSFPTGDYGSMDEEGVLHVYGRADQVINVGGERVSLIKIEQVMRACPGVDDAVATGIREENGEQWPLVVVNGTCAPGRDRLREHLEAFLARAAWPWRIFFLGEWPLLPNDKPDRKRIIAAAKSGELELVWEL